MEGIKCNGKVIPNRQTEGAAGQTREKGEHNSDSLRDMKTEKEVRTRVQLTRD